MELKFMCVRETAGEAINSPDAVSSIMSVEALIDRECFWVLHLNSGNRLIEKELVSMGTLSSSLVHPREVFKKAVMNGSAGIITVHNHPSGSIKPSKEDKEIWKALDEAGEILGIEVLDHVIITPEGKIHSEREVNVKTKRR